GQPRFGFWSYNNGFGLISAGGEYLRYNLTSNSITESNADDEASHSETVRNGKAIVQALHQDLIKR
ncbi:MAG: hypothetical protein IKC78_05560, partial [Alistipes sp.]|nr:hypothetical protein [Alistipes sp.]